MKWGEYYEHGYRVGWSTSRNCRSEIEKLYPSDLPGVCGAKLEVVTERIEKFFTDTLDWKRGFFDGFMDCSEQFLGNSS